MGDVAMLVPVVSSLARQYPQVKITVLSRPFAAAFFENLASNVSFIPADIKKEYHGISGLNRLFHQLVKEKFTAIADMHGVLRTHYLRLRFKLSGHRTACIDKHRKGKRQLAAKEHKVLKQQPTSFENYAEVLQQLGYPVKLDFTSIYNDNHTAVELPAIGNKQNSEFWIGIAPFSAHEGKVYPMDKMKRVIELIQNKYENCRIFLFGGGKKEKEQLDHWCTLYNKCTCVARALGNLQQEIALMSHLNVMVSMDSANMHMASLVHTPVVSIWGATHPYAGFMGWNQQISNAVQVDLPCRPCSVFGNKPCLRGDFACMNTIQPETILQKIDHVINK